MSVARAYRVALVALRELFNDPRAQLIIAEALGGAGARRIAKSGAERQAAYKKRKRLEIIERDGLVCRLCGEKVLENEVEIDHIVPRAHGGTDHPSNLQVAHSHCNRARGARMQ